MVAITFESAFAIASRRSTSTRWGDREGHVKPGAIWLMTASGRGVGRTDENLPTFNIGRADPAPKKRRADQGVALLDLQIVQRRLNRP